METKKFALPPNMPLVRARSLRKELLANLSREEFRIMECAFSETGHVFGGPDSASIVLSKFIKAIPPKRKGTEVWERMDHGGSIVKSLVRRGWLRFAEGASEGFGYFWPTECAKTLWKVLEEKATVVEFERRKSEEAL